ncbi:MAG: beta-lactamase family protein [Planctomycetaceae bacterium]|nr:beta-lactamase family protein [Planctomycetaceae bacterium]
MRLAFVASAILAVWVVSVSSEEAAAIETPLPVAEPEQVGMSAKRLKLAPSALRAMVDDGKIAGAVIAVARHGKLVLHEAVGKADREVGKPMTTDTIFRFYSMTKPITSTAVMMLVDEGKLGLDDPVGEYLPALADAKVYVSHRGTSVMTDPATQPITVRDLLRHTSGLTYGFFGDTFVDNQYKQNAILFPFFSLEETVNKLGTLPLLYQPGTRFHYSVSTDVLARLVEVVSGQAFNEFLDERIFTPLGMDDTDFYVVEANQDRLATIYAADESTGQIAVDRDPSRARGFAFIRPKFLSGGGGLFSTSSDYIRFCQMLLNNGELDGIRLLKPETVEAMGTNQLPKSSPYVIIGPGERKGVGFGLGLSVVVDDVPGSPHVPKGELGWGGMASTHFWLSPKHDLAVVVLTQRLPFTFQAEAAVKPIIYRAVVDERKSD